MTAKIGSFEKELPRALKKGSKSKICRIISVEEFTFSLVIVFAGAAAMGAASEECSVGVADAGAAAMGAASEKGAVRAARVDDLVSAEKQENDMGIRPRRDAKSGVRNALASSGAEIQAKQELSGKLADNKSRNSNE